MAVVAAPGEMHNPLLLYGRSGSGKTLLLRAIEQRIREDDREARIERTAAAKLADQIVAALRADAYTEFRKWIAQNDVFVIDDLDIVADRPRTLEEILVLMEECVRSGVQVVITTATHPGVFGLTRTAIARRYPRALTAKLHIAREVTARRARAQRLFEQGVSIDS